MAHAFKCDRCFRCLEGKPEGTIRMLRYAAHTANSLELELCGDCFGECIDVAKRLREVKR